jgi:hypothetical protein
MLEGTNWKHIFSRISSVPLGKCQDTNINYVTVTFVHILFKLQFTSRSDIVCSADMSSLNKLQGNRVKK